METKLEERLNNMDQDIKETLNSFGELINDLGIKLRQNDDVNGVCISLNTLYESISSQISESVGTITHLALSASGFSWDKIIAVTDSIEDGVLSVLNSNIKSEIEAVAYQSHVRTIPLDSAES